MHITFALICLLLIQSLLHYYERKDLYTRLQSKDLNDYNRAKGKPPDHNSLISAHKRTLERWKRGADK